MARKSSEKGEWPKGQETVWRSWEIKIGWAPTRQRGSGWRSAGESYAQTTACDARGGRSPRKVHPSLGDRRMAAPSAKNLRRGYRFGSDDEVHRWPVLASRWCPEFSPLFDTCVWNSGWGQAPCWALDTNRTALWELSPQGDQETPLAAPSVLWSTRTQDIWAHRCTLAKKGEKEKRKGARDTSDRGSVLHAGKTICQGRGWRGFLVAGMALQSLEICQGPGPFWNSQRRG